MRRSCKAISWQVLCLIFLVLPCLSFFSCSQEPSAEERSRDVDHQAGSASSSSSQTGAAQDEAGAVGELEINGVRITREEIQKVAAPDLAKIDKYAGQQPALAIQQQKQDVYAKVVRKIIIEELLSQEAQRQGIEVSGEEIDEKIKTLAHGLEPPLTVAEYRANAEAGGTTLVQLREEARRGVAFDKLFGAELEGKLDVTEEEARAYFDDEPDEFVIPEKILVSHILIQPEASDDPNKARAEARIQIEDLLEQIKQGADFAELARAHSTCESRSRGGSLNYVKEGHLSPAFDEAAFALRVDEVSEIVEAGYGFHIIKVHEHNQEDVFAFEDVRDQVIEDLVEAKRLEAIRRYIHRLEEEAEISDYTTETRGLGPAQQ